MGFPQRRPWRRRLLVLGTAVVLLLVLIAFFFPYLLKRYIERHSEEWIDRKVTIDRLVLNPFTFRYGVYGVTCYEPKGSPEVFVSWSEISVRSNLWRGFRDNNWRFTRLRIKDPYFHIVQQGDRFNFSDLMELGGRDTTASTDTSTTRFSMEDIRIEGGRIDYASDILKAPVTVQDLHAECTRITSADARMDFKLGFGLAAGGEVDGGFTIDTDRSLYAIDAKLRRFALPQLLPYLQDFMHTTALQGSVDLGLALRDSWADTTALAVRADLAVNGFDLTDGQGGHLIGLKTARVDLDTLDARTSSFKLRRVLVDGLTTRYQQWADGSNTWTKALILDPASGTDSTQALAASASNVFVMLADYIRMLGQEFVANQYTADSMVMAHSAVDLEDFTPEKPFRYKLSDVDIRSSRINTAAGTADFNASALLNDRGRLQSTFKFDPKDFRNVDATLAVEDLALQDLDPYSRWYAAYPLQEGVMAYTGSTSIHGGRLDSRNKIVVGKLKFGKKTDIHDTGIYVLPLRLAAGLLKDVHGNIDLDVPVKGDLNDPTFKVWPIVWQVLKNLVVKAGTAPVRLVARAFQDVDEQDLESVRFGPTQAAIAKAQRKPLDMLVKLLKEKSELVVDLTPTMDLQQTLEEWAAFEAKKRYLQLTSPVSEADSSRMMDLSLRDEAFLAWLDGQSPGTKGQAERSRCLALIGTAQAKQVVEAQETARRMAVLAYMKAAGVAEGRCRIRPGTKEELAGFVGDPGYRFVFDGAD